MSFLSAQSEDNEVMPGPKAVRLVKLWQKAERNKTTLSVLLGSQAAWIEDVEDILAEQQDEVKAAFEKELAKRI